MGSREIVLGGGCFWCVEAVFERLEGVLDAVSGYSGGTVSNPSYEQVITGRTGHAEVVRITYDPGKISLEQLLELFWRAHDPTTLNRQGADVGTQYRSIILYSSPEEKDVIQKSLTRAQSNFKRPIVTQVQALEIFWEAEEYHQDYFAKNPQYGYCQVVIAPKLRSLGLEGLY